MGKSTILMVLGLLLTLGWSLRTQTYEEEEEEEEDVEEVLNIRLPGYTYCGPGNDFLEQLKNWPENEPINKLDLACFYHDLVYSDANSTPKDIRESDLLVINRAKEIYKSLKGGFFSKLKYKAELQIVIKAFQAKMALENKGLLNPLSLISKDPTYIEQINQVISDNNLPDAWGLPYSF